MPPAFPGSVISFRAESPVLDRSWRCELSAPANLPVGGADVQGSGAGDGATSCATATTASCRLSRHAALKTTYCAITFISGLSPLLRTANFSSVVRAIGRTVCLRGEHNKTCKVPSTPVDGPLWLFSHLAKSVIGPLGADLLTNSCFLSGQNCPKGTAQGWTYQSRRKRHRIHHQNGVTGPTSGP